VRTACVACIRTWSHLELQRRFGSPSRERPRVVMETRSNLDRPGVRRASRGSAGFPGIPLESPRLPPHSRSSTTKRPMTTKSVSNRSSRLPRPSAMSHRTVPDHHSVRRRRVGGGNSPHLANAVRGHIVRECRRGTTITQHRECQGMNLHACLGISKPRIIPRH
jgi:hypothetical protein